MDRYEDWLHQADQHRRQTGGPLVSLCFAQSLDGCLTAQRGQPTPLSGPQSSRLTHQLRTAHDAILVGVGTVIADNPRLTVRHVEGRNPQPVVQRNNHYTISEVILALVYPIALGFGRIETTHLLRHNGVFQYLAGLPSYPDPQTLGRFLLRMAPLSLPKLRRLHDKLLSSMMQKPSPPTRIIFVMDSTVLASTASRRWPTSDTIRRNAEGHHTIHSSASTASSRITGTENSDQAMLIQLRAFSTF